MLPVTQRMLIPINIETLAGTSFELLVSPYEQIQYIKRKIEKREGIPMSHQYLIWKSTELEDESCLNDYNIEAGSTVKLVLAMRGGPVNTRRVPLEDSFIRDMSEYMESSREDYGNDLCTDKNVTFLVLRDGDQFNFFQVIDRGDGILSPLQGPLSAASMHNTREILAKEAERKSDEKRQADDRKTKQKLESIRSKLKNHPKKDNFRPSSSSKSNLLLPPPQHRSIHVETSSNLSTNGDNSSGTSSLEVQQHRSLSYSFSTNLFNTYNLLSTVTRNELLHEEDTEEDDDDDSPDEDEDIKPSSQPIFTSRSFSPSVFYHQHNTTKKLLSQETATTTTAVNNTSSNAVLVDYIPRISPTLPLVSTSSRILSASKCLNTSDQPINAEEKKEILFHHSRTSPMLELINDGILSPTTHMRKQTADRSSRNETSLSKPIWTDDDEQINLSDGRTSTSQSILFRHQNSSTSTTAVTPVPTLPQLIQKSSPQSQFSYRKSFNPDQQKSKASPRPTMPAPKYRRMPANVSSNETNQNNDSFNEHLMLNRRIEILKTPAKQQPPTPSPTSSIRTSFPPPPSKKPEIKPNPTATPSMLPMDSTKVTIETIGPKTVSALLRQNATIEPVDTSRGVGKHLVSLLATASKETVGYKQTSRDAIIEERYKLPSRLTNPWSNPTATNSSIITSSLQSNTAAIYNTNKLPPVIVNRKSTSKCFLCKKKIGLATTYQCRCGSSFCSEHRYPEAHACAFDYKAEGKRLIERNNPLVTAPKLPKI